MTLALILSPLNAGMRVNDCEDVIRKELYPLHYDFKSIKGWIRVFSNKSKYNVYKKSEEDRLYLLEILKNCEETTHVGVMK